MPIVVADAGPPHYLILIDAIGLLPRLFGHIAIPASVRKELTHARAPERVRCWIDDPPRWLEVSAETWSWDDDDLRRLDTGERDVIAMARARGANIVLMDDRRGVAAANAAGLRAIGTLGVLELASRRGWIELAPALDRLQGTNFRVTEALVQGMKRRASDQRR